MMRKRVLVTGGAGFLGSHLCDRLVQADHDVGDGSNRYQQSVLDYGNPGC